MSDPSRQARERAAELQERLGTLVQAFAEEAVIVSTTPLEALAARLAALEQVAEAARWYLECCEFGLRTDCSGFALKQAVEALPAFGQGGHMSENLTEALRDLLSVAPRPPMFNTATAAYVAALMRADAALAAADRAAG